MNLIGRKIIEKRYNVMTMTSRCGTIETRYNITDFKNEITTAEITYSSSGKKPGTIKTFHIEELNIDNNNYSCILYD